MRVQDARENRIVGHRLRVMIHHPQLLFGHLAWKAIVSVTSEG
jgi:hypothetical protein